MDGTTHSGLAALERRIARELEALCLPAADWVKPRFGPDGRRAQDVLIVGAGMMGLIAAFALIREGVRNVRVLDRNPAGREGPWTTFARMATLRSPKHLPGPAMGMASLTFRCWWEAQHGPEGWERLGKIPTAVWQAYLNWYRAVLRLPVENEVEVTDIRPAADGMLEVRLSRAGREEVAHARKVVLATGRGGCGGWQMPPILAGLDRRLWTHAFDEIDFAAFAGRRIAVIGSGATGFDNAACALAAGAERVAMFVRRSGMPRINKFKQVVYPGYAHGFAALTDAQKWRNMWTCVGRQSPAPHESVRAIGADPRFSIHFASPWQAVREAGGRVEVETPRARLAFDHVIAATGFAVDLSRQPELASLAPDIALWRDRYEPPADARSDFLASFPYLAPDFAFTERRPGAAPWLADIHCLNYVAELSVGVLSADIPNISEGAQRLATAVARRFFLADQAAHHADLEAFDEQELAPSDWPGAEERARRFEEESACAGT